MRPLLVGTRGSPLARWQTEFVVHALKKIAPALEIELHVITTHGDRDPTRPLNEFGGRGVFTTEIENALRNGEIDFAVHSLKDLPTDEPRDLTLAAILPREDARDVLVSRHTLGLNQLPHGARVGTSSARRTAQLLALRPDFNIIPLRGNVDTRLRKANTDEYDAIVLAAAGLIRLERASVITQYFSFDQMLPDPGQGALAVQIRAGDSETCALIAQLDHAPTRAAVTAERAFLAALGGSCSTPTAAYAELNNNVLYLRGVLASDSTRLIRGELRGSPDQPEALGKALAKQISERINSHE